MQPPVERSIVLVGFMAAGKSKIGSLLAERLRLPFVDTDAEIETAYGRSISALFRDLGEAEFRRAERELISSKLTEPAQVIALGGGAFIDEANREALNRGAQTVWLDTPFELITQRVARSKHRPLASSRSKDELRALWEERRPCYQVARIRIDTADAEPERIVERIIEALGYAVANDSRTLANSR